MIRIDTTPTHLRVLNTPFHTKDVLKVLPGARWDGDVRAWVFPKSSTTAAALRSLFPAAEIDAGAEAILDKGAAEAQAILLKSSADLPDVPTTTRSPWLHQKQGFWFAAHRLGLHAEGNTPSGGVMLAMDMGTGKTKVIYDLMNSYSDRLRTVLVTCPKAVCETWEEEREKNFTGGTMHLLILKDLPTKTMAARAKQFLESTEGSQRVIVINHESIWRESFKAFVRSQVWDLLIVDECHRAKAAGGRFSTFLGRSVPYFSCRIGLTGTPMPNNPMDLYAQSRFIDPSVYGTSFTRFKARYGIWGGFQNRKLVGINNKEELYEKLDSFCFRVKLDDVLDLPPVTHMRRYCELGAERAVYDQMCDDMIADVKGGVITAANALVRLLRLQQIVQGSLTDDEGVHREIGTAKYDLLIETLKDIHPDEPVVVFCHFVDDVERVARACEELGRQCFKLRGGINQLAEWKAGRDGRVLAAQIQTGGLGVDLSSARYTIYYSPTFDMGAYEQSLARTHRPGQLRPTFYYHLLAKGTIDTNVYAALSSKKRVVETVLAGITGGYSEG
jgi:SNF2 family DNA or RNA helicase